MAAWNWYYNHITGLLTQMVGAEAALLNHEWLGWHGPFQTKDDALSFYSANKEAHPDWKEPKESLAQKAIDKADKTITDATSTLNDPFHIQAKLDMLQNWFVRGGEIVLGLVLIAVGVSHLSGNGGSVIALAKTASKFIK